MAPSNTWRADAIDAVRSGEAGWEGLCLKRVRTLLGVPARHPSAWEAWKHAQDRHYSRNPPRGVPVFWRGGRWGHVALSDGNGMCFSTDIKRKGKLDRVKISLIHDRWGYVYVGWSEDVNGVRVYDPNEVPQRDLSHGMRGADVRRLQEALAKVGQRIQVDGVFGEQTRGALNAFKATRGWPRDGIAGRRVRHALGLER